MHAGFLQINREKMSKSLGNFFTIREVLESYPKEVIRYFLLSSHYRSQLNYYEAKLDSAHDALERFYSTLRGIDDAEAEENSEFEKEFNEAMDDDFNTPEALAALFNIAREINRIRDEDQHKANRLGALLKKLGSILGVIQHRPEEFLQSGVADEEAAKIEALINERLQARKDKDWGRADEIRDQLHAMGIELEDKAESTIWRKV